MNKLQWDVFICHASEDKDPVARPLANLIAAHMLRVWMDEGEIRPGDSVRATVDKGLASSRYGVVILSPAFFGKPWCNAELSALFAREMAGQRVLIPVWHELRSSDVALHSPLLADRLALNTAIGLPQVAAGVAKLLRQEAVSYRPGMPVHAGRLTKKLLKSLPEGAYLLSNVFNPDMTPKVSQTVPPTDQRDSFWLDLKAEKISTTRFYVFTDAAEYRAHMSARRIWV